MARYSAALIPIAWRVVPNLSEGLRWAGVLLGSVELDLVGPMAEMPLRSESPRIALTSASVVQVLARRPSCSPRVRRNCFALSRTHAALPPPLLQLALAAGLPDLENAQPTGEDLHRSCGAC